MKPRNIFLSSIALAALVIIAFAAFVPATSAGGNKKELTACEKEDLKYKPQVEAFKKAYLRNFNAKATNAHLAQTDTTALARHKYAALTGDQRRAVWKAKFDQVDLNDLNPIQSEYLERVVASLDSMKFDGTDDRESGVALGLEGRNLFKRSEFLNLFGTLKTTTAVMKASTQIVPECHCNNETAGGWVDNFCWTIPPYNLECNNWSTPCIRTNPGCGWLWSWVCNGLCLPMQ
jgi:hypothetical protein